MQQLASLAEKVEIVGDSGVVGSSSNPSPTPSFNLADLFAGDHAISNLQALAKLGNNLANSDNATLNGSNNFILGRGQSPGIVDAPNLGSLAVNGMLNGGYQSLSASTSPIMPPTPSGEKTTDKLM